MTAPDFFCCPVNYNTSLRFLALVFLFDVLYELLLYNTRCRSRGAAITGDEVWCARSAYSCSSSGSCQYQSIRVSACVV